LADGEAKVRARRREVEQEEEEEVLGVGRCSIGLGEVRR
jgi:hypothetical protein